MVLQERIGYRFKDLGLLEQSLTHRSRVGDCGGETDNERLEFLGDAVLELAVTDWLFRKANSSEGRLTQVRARLVNRRTLHGIAKRIGLGDFIRLGRGEANSGGAQKASINANCLEALIGAVYLDSGFEEARDFVRRILQEAFYETLDLPEVRDSKSILQEFSLANVDTLPSYDVLEAAGQDHKRTFRVRVSLGDVYRMTGTGKTKQAAEMDAAQKLLEVVHRDSKGER